MNIEYYLELTKEQYHTLRVKGEDGTVRYLHSKYHPTKESAYLKDIVNPLKYDTCIILGTGLGYHLAYLYEIIDSFTQIICIDIHNYLSECEVAIPHNIKSFLQHPKVHTIIVDPHNTSLLFTMVQLQYTKGVQVIEHPASINAFPNYFTTIKQTLQNIIEKSISNELTVSFFAYRYLKNALCNLIRLPVCYPVVQFKNIHYNEPCIIVAPGPSLDAIAEYIRTSYDTTYIIAVDSAVKPLLQHQIIPDYSISIDPQPIVHAHTFGTHVQSRIITTLTAHPLTFASPAILSLNTHPVCQLIEELSPGAIGSIDSKTGTVLGDAIQFALLAGFNPIIIAGADFSFPQLTTYARHTEYHFRYALAHNRMSPLETQSVNYIFKSSKRTNVNTQYTRKVFMNYHTAIDALLPDDRTFSYTFRNAPCKSTFTITR